MKKLIWLSLLLLVSQPACADVNNPLIFEEPDGSPSTTPSKVKFTNGSITNNGDGSITVNVAAGASGISSADINTSAELATIITDEIGTGNILFNTNPILSSDVTITGSAGFLHSSAGTITSSAMIDDQILVATGVTTASATSIGDCDDSSGNHLNYDTATNAFSCGTSSSATNSSGWADNGTKIVQVTSTDGVVVGPSPTELGKVTISGDTDEVQLAIKAHTSQTANVIEIKNSAGTNIASLTNAGNLTIAGTLTVGGSSALTTLGDNLTASYTLSFDISGVDQTIIAESGKLSMSGDLVVARVDTGFGLNELYDMDQHVLTTSSPTFVDTTVTTEAYDATGWNSDNTVPTKDATRDKVEIIKKNMICGTTNSTFTATFYMSAASTGSSTEAATQLNIAPITGTVSNLYFKFQNAPDNGGGTQSWTIVAEENNVGTAVTCAVSEAETSCSDTSNSFTLDAGNYMNFSVTAANTPANTGSIGYCYQWEPTA